MAYRYVNNIWAQIKQFFDADIRAIVNAGPPVNGTDGLGFAGPGSIYLDTVTGLLYTNTGTKAAPVWSDVTVPQISGAISAADIVSVAAGKFGHANGVEMVPAPGAGKYLELISVELFYHYGVAAYGAGGNITANWTAGAAITGLVSAANSVGAAADKNVLLIPLAAAGLALVVNTGISLVSSGAFTNPGTATGTISWRATYRTHSVL